MGNKVLAISSGGGHWIQLRRITDGLAQANLVFASVGARPDLAARGEVYYAIPDATRWDKLKLLWMATRVCLLVLWLRPAMVISTGAAPGFVAVRFAKLLGARCLWIDSIANVSEVSMSCRKAAPHVDLCLTQWVELVEPGLIEYSGSVLPDVYS